MDAGFSTKVLSHPNSFPQSTPHFGRENCLCGASLVAQTVKNLPTIWELWVRSLGQEEHQEGDSYPLQYSCLEGPMDRGAWRASPRGRKESDTTERHSLPHGSAWSAALNQAPLDLAHTCHFSHSISTLGKHHAAAQTQPWASQKSGPFQESGVWHESALVWGVFCSPTPTPAGPEFSFSFPVASKSGPRGSVISPFGPPQLAPTSVSNHF